MQTQYHHYNSQPNHSIEQKHPKIFQFAQTIATDHKNWVLPVVLIYAAFAPLPNELILIPLAVAGVRFSHLLLPLIIGSLVHQLLFTYGATSIVSFIL